MTPTSRARCFVLVLLAIAVAACVQPNQNHAEINAEVERRLSALEKRAHAHDASSPPVTPPRSELEIEPATTVRCPGDPICKSLAAWWPVDGDGSDVVGRWPLSRGSFFDDRMKGSWQSFRDGKAGRAIAIKDNVPGLAAESSPVDMEKDFALAFWSKLEGRLYDGTVAFENGALMVCVHQAFGERLGLFVMKPNGETVAQLSDETGGQPLEGGWHHVVIVRRSDRLTLFVDAFDKGFLDVRDFTMKATGHTRIAFQRSGYPWQGAIDEVAMWSRALSNDEVTRLYNDGNGVFVRP